jgi:hypothetical protein
LEKVESNKHWQEPLNSYFSNVKLKYKNQLYQQTETGLHYFFKDEWVMDEKKGVYLLIIIYLSSLKFVHTGKLNKQKEVLKFLLRKLGANLIAGKSILDIPLPVSIFEKRSNLERFAISFTLAPYFLERAAQMKDPLE